MIYQSRVFLSISSFKGFCSHYFYQVQFFWVSFISMHFPKKICQFLVNSKFYSVEYWPLTVLSLAKYFYWDYFFSWVNFYTSNFMSHNCFIYGKFLWRAVWAVLIFFFNVILLVILLVDWIKDTLVFLPFLLSWLLRDKFSLEVL